MNTTSSKGAAATGHSLTTKAAIEILDAGGNAFDAAIAAAFMACVCEPVLASPGGGGFAMIHTSNCTNLLDFFAQTPICKQGEPLDFLEINADFGDATQQFHIGHASSAVPGFIPGLFKLHEKHARLAMARLIAPARNAALNGVEITPFQHYLSSVVAPILLHSKQSRAVFAPHGHLHKANEVFCNPDLADFYDQLAEKGQGAFPIQNILSDQKTGGHLQSADFKDYQIVERDSHTIEIAGAKVHLNPKPAAGGDMIAMTFAHLKGIEPIHIAQALRKTDDIRRQTSNDFGSQVHPPSYRGTTQISVVDAQQNACSMTLSNGEGNGYMVNDCGFMLNNMLGEADINPGGKLGWPENTRMSSMMCPTIIEHPNGSITALGSGGSNRIRSTISQVLINLLLKNNDIPTSINSPRLHIEDQHLDFEALNDENITDQLKSAFTDNRQWSQKNMFFGGCHIASVNDKQAFEGFGDPRRQGYFATT